MFDPFSGRGTTLLEARLAKRRPIASDLNPLAVAITRAKNVSVAVPDILARIAELEQNFDLPLYLPEANVQPEDIQLIYHPHSLAQLCFLRRHLVRSTNDVDVFLVGLVLGIMHGGERKDGSSPYASIDMPNTFSMSPSYVRRYVQQHRLRKVPRDIFELLRNRVRHLMRGGLPQGESGVAVQANVRHLTDVGELRPYRGQVRLVVTSPPYLNIVHYARQNWIRLWFLGESVEDVSANLDDDLSISESVTFLEESCRQIKQFLRPEDGVLVLVIGDVVRSGKTAISPARELLRRLFERGWFSYMGYLSDRVHPSSKTTRIWKATRGRATEVDRIIVLADRAPTFYYESLRELNLPIHEAKGLMAQFDADRLRAQALSFAGISG